MKRIKTNQFLKIGVIVILTSIAIILLSFKFGFPFKVKYTRNYHSISTSYPLSQWLFFENQNPYFKINYPPDWEYNISKNPETGLIETAHFTPKNAGGNTKVNKIIFRVNDRKNAKDLSEWVSTVYLPQIKEVTSLNNLVINFKKIYDDDVPYVIYELPFPIKETLVTYFRLNNNYVYTFMVIRDMASDVVENMISSFKTN